MNKQLNTLNSASGQEQPITSQSIQFLQTAYNEQTSLLAQALIINQTNPNIGGVYNLPDLTSGLPYVITGMVDLWFLTVPFNPLGYVWYQGAIYQCLMAPGVPADTASASLYATFSTTNTYSYNGVAADPIYFTDGNPYYVHNDTTINFTNNPAGALFPFSSLQFMAPVPVQISNATTPLQAEITTLQTIPAWQTFAAAGITINTGWTASGGSTAPMVTKDTQGRVYFKGLITFIGSSTNTGMFTMPASYNTSGIVALPIVYSTGGTAPVMTISISNGGGSGGGIVAIVGPGSGPVVPSGLTEVYLSGIHYITL